MMQMNSVLGENLEDLHQKQDCQRSAQQPELLNSVWEENLEDQKIASMTRNWNVTFCSTIRCHEEKGTIVGGHSLNKVVAHCAREQSTTNNCWPSRAPKTQLRDGTQLREFDVALPRRYMLHVTRLISDVTVTRIKHWMSALESLFAEEGRRSADGDAAVRKPCS